MFPFRLVCTYSIFYIVKLYSYVIGVVLCSVVLCYIVPIIIIMTG